MPSRRAVHFNLVYGNDRYVADWCAKRLPNFMGWGTEPRTIGYTRDGKLKGAVVYTNYSGKNVFASIVMEAPFTRRFLYAAFWCPFVQFACNHLNGIVERSNHQSLRLCKHLGFKCEGVLREAAADGGDIIVMGMLKSECRWLRIKL